MRILLVHNYYRQPGGEDEVFAGESRLLERHGHDVSRYVVHNDSVGDSGKLALARDTIWNRRGRAELRRVIERERPEVVHFHNTLPLISPSAYYAASDENVPVVQTLHNYRLICPNAILFRDGRPCQDCVGKPLAVPGIVHACYRGDRAASATVAMMTALHGVLGTWTRQVSLYIALTNFAKTRLVEGGLPADMIIVKPNFVDPDPLAGDGKGGYALFVGRLSPEKGVRTMLAAWRMLGAALPLRIVGDGPMGSEVALAASELPNVQWLGRRSAPEVLALMRDAVCLICPSEWYETFGRVIVEAYAAGTPVIASNIGALTELVIAPETGILFPPGDAGELASSVLGLVASESRLQQMRRAARREFELKFTAARNYGALMDIYRLAIDRRTRGVGELQPVPG